MNQNRISVVNEGLVLSNNIFFNSKIIMRLEIFQNLWIIVNIFHLLKEMKKKI